MNNQNQNNEFEIEESEELSGDSGQILFNQDQKEEEDENEKDEEEKNYLNNEVDDLKQLNQERELAKKTDEAVMIGKTKLILIKNLLRNIEDNSKQLTKIISGFVKDEDDIFKTISQEENLDVDLSGNSKIIEGVFDGENMIGPDGKQYSISSNYASKSKLVEGDILKLTIAENGKFLYKQIGPIERSRIIGTLKKNSDGSFVVFSDEYEREWLILNASVTFFKGQSGDEVVLLVPKNGDSQWGAVENIIKKGHESDF